MATYSIILAWEIPWTDEPGRLQSVGWQRVRHDWACTHTRKFLLLTTAVKTRNTSVCVCVCVSTSPHTCTFIHLCPTLCDTRDSSPPRFSEHENFQVGILHPVVISYYGGSSQPRNWTCFSWSIVHKFFTTMPHLLQGETLFLGAPKSLQMVTAAMKLKDVCSLEEKLCLTSVQFSCSVVSNSLRPHVCSMPGLPVHHQLPEFTQAHVHRVIDAIQPSYPLSSPSPPAPNPSQHLFQWVNSSHEVASTCEFDPSWK